MRDLLAIFRAGLTRRWHTNPDLAHTCDRIDGHSARVARIILALHPFPPLDLIRAALIHDDGESVVGDMSFPTKSKFKVLADALDEAEEMAIDAMWGQYPTEGCGPVERAWLTFADRLDAYMWAAHHAPLVLGRDGWPEAREWLRAEAERLGAEAGVDAIVDMGVRHAA